MPFGFLRAGPRLFVLAVASGVAASTFGPAGARAADDGYPPRVIAAPALVSEVAAVAPGRPFWVALRLELRDGWHTYWRNPGDSGVETQIRWRLPDGFRAGSIVWPAPHRFVVGPLMNFGYEHEVWLLSRIEPPAGLATTSPVVVAADAQWLVCEKICVPEQASLSLALPVAEAPADADAETAAAFAEARRRLPAPSPWPAAIEIGDGALTVSVEAPGLDAGGVGDPWFFPAEYGVIDHAAPQPARFEGGAMRLTLKRDAASGDRLPARIAGVLAFERDGERRAYALDLPVHRRGSLE